MVTAFWMSLYRVTGLSLLLFAVLSSITGDLAASQLAAAALFFIAAEVAKK